MHKKGFSGTTCCAWMKFSHFYSLHEEKKSYSKTNLHLNKQTESIWYLHFRNGIYVVFVTIVRCCTYLAVIYYCYCVFCFLIPLMPSAYLQKPQYIPRGQNLYRVAPETRSLIKLRLIGWQDEKKGMTREGGGLVWRRGSDRGAKLSREISMHTKQV